MSCPECGSRFSQKNLTKLYIATAAIIVIFGATLFYAQIEIFFAVAIGILFVLRRIESGFSEIEKHELRCPKCGHVVRFAHNESFH